MNYQSKIHSIRKNNVVTIYVPNFCLNELSQKFTLDIINTLEKINTDTSIDMVILRTVQENYFLPKFPIDDKSFSANKILKSDYFIKLTQMIQNMRAMTVAVIEGTANFISSSFLKAYDLSYATENTAFTNKLNINSSELFSAKQAEDLGLITRVVPTDKIDITLDYLINTYTVEDE
ncbi:MULTISPECIES: Clp protease/crotonase-like domain-containing protein [Flammeovirga]|uniref:Uncharacterized protein n=1 Tax=Flammeovirga agarivorans TaxID=2726742 RepID=A0A7X8XZ32_9BACT|nr:MULTISPECIES: hypothetical protein [Flammeovirga]NLR94774.1 hypothetical protein [Flammeovirga agarivorans]